LYKKKLLSSCRSRQKQSFKFKVYVGGFGLQKINKRLPKNIRSTYEFTQGQSFIYFSPIPTFAPTQAYMK
jgi:hypothetical protein